MQQPQQTIQSLQEQTGPNITKVAILLMAFGFVGYLWVKTSRLLIDEIEK